MAKTFRGADIYRSDVLEFDIPGEWAHLTVTSPPYNVGVDYGDATDDMDYPAYLMWSLKWLRRVYEWTVPTGRLCLNIPIDTNKHGPTPFYADLTRIAMDAGWKYKGTIIWNKNSVLTRTAWGSWMSASAPTVLVPCELILVMYKDEWKRQVTVAEDDISHDEFIDWTSGLWNISPESATRIGHPAPFPEEIPYRCIKLYSFIDDVVLDPFAGSGTTIITAIQNKRKAIGIEINEKFYNRMENRIYRECSQLDLF